MRHSPVVAACAFAAGCASTPASPPRAAAVPPNAAPSAAVPAAKAARAPWALVFRRGCSPAARDNAYTMAIARDQSAFAVCGSLWGFERGEYRGRTSATALLGADAALDASWNDSGVRKVRPSDDAGAPLASTGDGEVYRLVASADGKRALYEVRPSLQDDERRVVLLDLATFRPVTSAPLERPDGRTVLGFDAGGGPLVFTETLCEDDGVPATCGGLFRLGEGKLASVGEGFDDVHDIAFSEGGTRALLERENAALELVDLPSGRRVASLPPVHAHDSALYPAWGAVDREGARIALHTGDDVVLYDVADGKLDELHRMPWKETIPSLGFAPDGRSLFVLDGIEVNVLREGGRLAASPTPRYEPTLPPGFRKAVDGFEARDAEVHVRYVDPKQFEAKSEAAWVEQVVSWETTGFQDETTPPKSWTSPKGRAFEFALFRRTGCLPSDDYVRYAEADGVLYRISVEMAPGSPKKRVEPLLRAFFDAELGAPDTRRAFVKTERPGPC